MPRDYQRKTDNPYRLPDYAYKEVKYAVKDYDRKKSLYEDILHSSPFQEPGMPSGNGSGDPTEQKAIKLSSISDQIKAIDQALIQIPEDYRKGVFDEARYDSGFPLGADPRTYQRWKQKFLYLVAENKNII